MDKESGEKPGERMKICTPWAFSRLYMYVLPRLYFAASISLKILFMTKAARKKVQISAMG